MREDKSFSDLLKLFIDFTYTNPNKLALEFDVSATSVRRWIKEETTPHAVLQHFCKHRMLEMILTPRRERREDNDED